MRISDCCADATVFHWVDYGETSRGYQSHTPLSQHACKLRLTVRTPSSAILPRDYSKRKTPSSMPIDSTQSAHTSPDMQPVFHCRRHLFIDPFSSPSFPAWCADLSVPQDCHPHGSSDGMGTQGQGSSICKNGFAGFETGSHQVKIHVPIGLPGPRTEPDPHRDIRHYS